MANRQQIPPDVMAPQFGVGHLTRHLFICLGPDCCSTDVGNATWDYVKRRLRELNLAGGKESTCFRTKAQCLRICIDGPIAVVYPEGAWYRNVTVANAERIIREHVIGGRIVEDICFARDALGTKNEK
jgi:(2Fe-2S) ferredoxin